MTLRAGWLNRQLDEVAKEVENWPDWMKKEAAFAASEQSPLDRGDREGGRKEDQQPVCAEE
jgi:hypothetical protein